MVLNNKSNPILRLIDRPTPGFEALDIDFFFNFLLFLVFLFLLARTAKLMVTRDANVDEENDVLRFVFRFVFVFVR